jgi:hypothetical protein
MDPKTALGTGTASGSVPYTKTGTALRSGYHRDEYIHPDSVKLYYGWLRDIRIPIGERGTAQDLVAGPSVKITFDTKALDRIWNNRWFRLEHDPIYLLQQYGTEESILQSGLRLALSVRGINTRGARAKIIGDTNHELTHRGWEITPCGAWADILNGLSSGKLPS